MSKFWAVIISLIYAAGGLLTGYYAYAFRVLSEAPEVVIDYAMVSEFLMTNYVFIGPLLMILATLLHLSQIGKAKRVDQEHVINEKELSQTVNDNQMAINELRRQVAENDDLLDFCHQAIKDAASSRTLEDFSPPKDYPANEDSDYEVNAK